MFHLLQSTGDISSRSVSWRCISNRRKIAHGEIFFLSSALMSLESSEKRRNSVGFVLWFSSELEKENKINHISLLIENDFECTAKARRHLGRITRYETRWVIWANLGRWHSDSSQSDARGRWLCPRFARCSPTSASVCHVDRCRRSAVSMQWENVRSPACKHWDWNNWCRDYIEHGQSQATESRRDNKHRSPSRSHPRWPRPRLVYSTAEDPR